MVQGAEEIQQRFLGVFFILSKSRKDKQLNSWYIGEHICFKELYFIETDLQYGNNFTLINNYIDITREILKKTVHGKMLILG